MFANTDGGAGNPWFVIPKGEALLPIVLQKRQEYEFVSKDAPNDEGMFYQKKFTYGADARYAVGYTLPQLAWGSKQALDVAHFNTSIEKMTAMPGDNGSIFDHTDFILAVGPENRAAGQAIVEAEKLAGGASNTNYKSAELVVVPWLKA